MSTIDNSNNELNRKLKKHALAPIREHITDKIIETFAKKAGAVWRKSLFDPVLTILACIYGHTDGVKSTRKITDWMESFNVKTKRNRNGSDFCEARKRLKMGLFHRLTRYIFDISSSAAGQTFCGYRCIIADGTTVSMHRSKANRDYFGDSKNNKGRSKYPLARGFFITCMGTGAVMDYILMRYKWGEMRALYVMLRRLGSKYLLIADGGLFSYAALTLLTSSGSHGLFRLPAGKTKKKLSQRLAANDYLQLWERPDSRWSRFFRMLRSQPDTIVVRVITINLKRRGYRDLKLRLVTTLLDPEQVSVEDILKLYVKRWNVELDIRELKRSHLPEQLAARTPSTVKREFASGVLAYNATKMITALASEKTGNEVEARRISHTRAASLLASYFERMREADVTRLRALFNDLLIQVSRALAPIQLRPPEPRMVVRTRCRYKYLKMSRAEWREEQLA